MTNSPEVNECSRKRRHESEIEAREHMIKLKGSSNATAPERLHWYACTYCGGWHVGHFKKREWERMNLRGEIRV